LLAVGSDPVGTSGELNRQFVPHNIVEHLHPVVGKPIVGNSSCLERVGDEKRMHFYPSIMRNIFVSVV